MNCSEPLMMIAREVKNDRCEKENSVAMMFTRRKLTIV